MEYVSVCEKGFAKINLHLDIVGRLDGGYHSVKTVMQAVSIWDEVTVTLTECGYSAECDVPGVPTDEKNIAVRAVRLYCETIGSDCGAHIKIQKNIPMAAGMAGGSADAAAALRAINHLHGDVLTLPELCAIGSKLGADVPFCIVGGTAYADGKGDELHYMTEMPDVAIVAACEGEGVSTPWAYGLLDEIYNDFDAQGGYVPHDTELLASALKSSDARAIADSMYNIFEAPVLEARPVAADVRRVMLESGALGAMMSGSGPSVFGIFASDEDAERAAEALCAAGYRPYICRPVGKIG